MQFPKWLMGVVSGQLILFFIHEGAEIEKAKQPHTPEMVYFSYSTKDLTYFVSGATAGTLAISGSYVRPFSGVQYILQKSDGTVILYELA